jgi:hypothetical protein
MAKNEWKSTTMLIDAAIDILEQENPMTIRQLFYRLVSAAVIENCLADYQRVSKVMTKAREDERVPYEWIVDRSRATYRSSNFRDLKHLGASLEYACTQYRRDYWQDQPCHVEIWCEKDAVTGSIEEVREEYGLTVEAQRGFNSTTNVGNVAGRLLKQQRAGKEVVVFYLGDWDPSGAEIEADVQRRVIRVAERMGDRGLWNFEMKRVAIFKKDIADFHLPPLKVKPTDSRAPLFVLAHGDQAVELDALPPTELRARLRKAIDAVIDRVAWDRASMVEEAERDTCRRYAGVFKAMMDERES